MTDREMLNTLINCCEEMIKAKEKYKQHPGGGASQKIKNRLAQDLKIKEFQLGNAVFNIKQFLK